MVKKPNRSKDHFVPETYLKHFSNSSKSNVVWRYWKANSDNYKLIATCEQAGIRSLCRKEGGDYSPYWAGERPLDELFKAIENPYNTALKDFENKNYSETAKTCIAFNVARIRCWTQKRKVLVNEAYEKEHEKRRVFLAEDLRNNPDKYAESIENFKTVSKTSDAISLETLIEWLEHPRIRLKIDMHSSNIALIEGMLEAGLYYYRMPWTVVHNVTDKPFITSDNPACMIEMPNLPEAVYMPLTPKLAILIHIAPLNLSLPSIFKEGFLEVEEDVDRFNSLVVKFADQYVIANENSEWIKEIVKKHQNHREFYSEQCVAQGFDQNGKYEIIRKRFGI
jgi:hypothetical protein